MPQLIFMKWITRADLRAHPEHRFVFGDNAERVGMGGQAREFRGEPNAIGVATKWRPAMDHSAFFYDNDPKAWELLNADITKVQQAFLAGHDIVLPVDGLGTGLSELPKRAPRLHRHIVECFRNLHDNTFPWS